MDIDFRARRRWLKENNWEVDREALRSWLKIWLEGLEFERADELSLKWFKGNPAPGSNWTREDELRAWTAASANDPVAYEGCVRLLDALDYDDVPPDLRIWSHDVATKRIKEPKRPHGKHVADHTWRNARITYAVDACRSAGLSREEACRQIAKIPGTPGDQQVLDIYKETRKTGSILDGIKTVIGPLPPEGA